MLKIMRTAIILLVPNNPHLVLFQSFLFEHEVTLWLTLPNSEWQSDAVSVLGLRLKKFCVYALRSPDLSSKKFVTLLELEVIGEASHIRGWGPERKAQLSQCFTAKHRPPLTNKLDESTWVTIVKINRRITLLSSAWTAELWLKKKKKVHCFKPAGLGMVFNTIIDSFWYNNGVEESGIETQWLYSLRQHCVEWRCRPGTAILVQIFTLLLLSSVALGKLCNFAGI